MTVLHIVQCGIENGDKAWIEKAARVGLDSQTWTVPKKAKLGDEVVMYIGGYGFFATAIIKSETKERVDWPRRYGARLTSIKLIEPAISLGSILRNVPSLTWANYPRSITTPDPETAKSIRKLIQRRRTTGLPELDEESLKAANIDELRKVAILNAKLSAPIKERKTVYRARSLAIKLYVLSRANGSCEGCSQQAPFRKADGNPYLEPHHTHQLSDDGPDDPSHVIALCPNCHRRAHFADEATKFNASLIKLLKKIERRN